MNPLVLLPGMLATVEVWDGVAEQLAHKGEVRASRIDLDDSIAEMAESVLATAPRRFALAGHSLGGIVALDVLRRAPHRVTHLALVNASGRPAVPAQLAAWSELRAAIANGRFDDVVAQLARSNLPAARRNDAELIERQERMGRAVGAAGLVRQLSAQATRPDNREWLSEISIPVVVVTGRDDEVCPAAAQEEIVAAIPQAEHVVLECGHMSPMERPVELADVLSGYR